MNNLISVILPIYKEKMDWINSSINSILQQTYKNFELILIDDNPEDMELQEYLKKFSQDYRVKLFINEKNSGIVASLNRGIESSKGRYIARMDADDICLLNRFEIEIDYLGKKNVDFVMSNTLHVNSFGSILFKENSPELSSDVFEKQIGKRHVGSHPTWLAKREVFKKLKGYRDVHYAEDLDFELRAIENGFKIMLISEVTLRYRENKNSITSIHQLDMVIIAKKLRKIFNSRNDKLSNFPVNNINSSLDNISDKQRNRFMCFSNRRKEAVRNIKSGKAFYGFICYVMVSFYYVEYLDFLYRDIQFGSKIMFNKIRNYLFSEA